MSHSSLELLGVMVALGGVLVTLGGLIATILVFIKQSRISLCYQKAEYVYRLNDKYDDLCRFRCEHPKLMELAPLWTDKPLNLMTAEERAYHYYAGMTLGVFETAIYATFVAHTLSIEDYGEYVRPMLLQEVGYNLPVFKQFAERGSLAGQSKQVLQGMLAEIEMMPSAVAPADRF